MRFALVRVNERTDVIALYGGEADEKDYLNHEFDQVLSMMRRLVSGITRLAWVTAGYGSTIITGQPFAHSLKAEPDFAAITFSCSTVSTVDPIATSLRYCSLTILCDGLSTDEAQARKAEEDNDPGSPHRAAACPC